MKAHAALKDEFGATPWWHGGGSLEWEPEPDRGVNGLISNSCGLGALPRSGSPKQVQELEPGLDPEVIGDAPVRFSRKKAGSTR